MEDSLVAFNKIEDGVQFVYRFPNNFGASVVCHSFSYGGDKGYFELGLIQFKNEDNNSWQLRFDNGRFFDAVGWLTFQQVAEYLDYIEKLDSSYPVNKIFSIQSE